MLDYVIMGILTGVDNSRAFFKGFWMYAFGWAGCIILVVLAGWFFYRMLATGSTTQGQPDWNEEQEKLYVAAVPKIRKIGITFVVISMIMGFIGVATPSMKQLAIIYVVPKIINNPNVKELPDNVLVLFNESLKELTNVVKGQANDLAKETSEAVKKSTTDAIKAASGVANKVLEEKLPATQEKK